MTDTPTSPPMVKPGQFVRSGTILALAVLIVDQITKWWVLDIFTKDPRTIEVLPMFNLVLVWNWGVSFGMFNGHKGALSWVLVVLALAICAFFARWLFKAESRLVAVGVALIIGGALGNVIDRVRFDAVVDFLDVHVMGYHWPAFNVADAAITIGAVALIIEAIFGDEAPDGENGDEKSDESS